MQPKLPDNFEDSTWSTLEQAIVAIQAKRPFSTSREELYRAAEDLCVHKMGARLYERYGTRLELLRARMAVSTSAKALMCVRRRRPVTPS